MNNKNDKQYSNMQEHKDNRIPASCKQEEIQLHKNKGKLHEGINTENHYGRISRNPDRLTYH